MSTCTCQHDGTKLTDVCALHAQFAREQSAAENAALRARLVQTEAERDAAMLLRKGINTLLAEAERKLDPRRWTKAESDAWQRAIPDTTAAFRALRDADSAAPAHVPDAHKCSFCAVGLVEMEYLRGKWWHIGTDTYDLCTAGVTVTAVEVPK